MRYRVAHRQAAQRSGLTQVLGFALEIFVTTCKKTLLVDGKPIADVPITGDIEKDIAAVKAAMKAVGLERSTSSLDALLQQAASFASTATYIYGTRLSRKPWDHFAVTPFVVNSVFAIELYLKAIGNIFGKDLRGHLLKTDLFDKLPTEASRLLDSLTAEYHRDKGADAPDDLRIVLGSLNNAFVLWRYPHEGKDAPYFKVSDSLAALDILHAACQEASKA